MNRAVKTLETAVRHHRAGRLDRAEHFYRKLLRQVPEHAEGLHGLGLIAHQRGYNGRAVELVSGAIDRDPERPLFYLNLGTILVAQGHPGQAIETLLTAVNAFRPAHRYRSELADINSQLGELYLEAGRPEAAVRHFEQAIQARPDFGRVHNMLGRFFHDTGDIERARDCYRTAMEIQPGLAESYCNMGNLLLETGSADAATGYLRRALQINPDYAEAYVNLGIAMLDQQDIPGAVAHFRYACQLQQDNADLHGYWCHALLLRGYYREGWAEGEWGLSLGKRVISSHAAPYWDGTSLVGRTVLVLSEQGVGDQIMFLSCLQDLMDRARPDRCILECDPRLLPLYRRSFPAVCFHARQRDISLSDAHPEADVKIAIGSLPRVFRARVEDFTCRAGYLIPDPKRVMRWRERYRSLGADKVIGISWRGGCTVQQRRKRSTGLMLWLPVLSTPAAAFVNLQYGDCRQELENANAGRKTLLHDWADADPLANLDDFAAQVAALDLVISIDNCTVHMAGAVGVPVWTLLPFVPDWRWMRYREDTPWYPGMKLFRQPKPGDWEAVFERIAKMLEVEGLPQTEGANAATSGCPVRRSPRSHPRA